MNHIGLTYYEAMGNKDSKQVAACLSEDVKLIYPLGTYEGKEAVLQRANEFFPLFEKLDVRTHIKEGNREAVLYDLFCPKPIGQVKTAAHLTIEKGLIKEIELFFDARPFV